MRTLSLDASDDIVSILDRLSWIDDTRRVALVLPEDGGVLREGVDMVRLRRYADRQRIEAGIVVVDPETARQARALGIPTFTTIAQAQTNGREWRRGHKRRERVGLATVGGYTVYDRLPPRPIDQADLDEMYRRMTPPSRRRVWLTRYAAILVFCLTVALLYLTAVMGIPSATITLYPETTSLQVARQIVADPLLESDTRSGASVPGRVLVSEQSLQADVATTGTADVPNSAATGSVLFANRLAQPVDVPAGTRVSTSDGSNVVFQTLEAVSVPGSVGATAETPVTAVEPGPQGNVGPNRINRVQGALATQLDVRNLEALEGGSTRPVAAVSQADVDRLRAQLLDALRAAALADMETRLGGAEFLAQDSAQIDILSETYSHFPGEETPQLTLDLRATVSATAVDTAQATDLLFSALGDEVPDGYTLVPESLRFTAGELLGVDEQGRVTFTMLGEATAAAELAFDAPLERVTGQELATAVSYLDAQLPLRAAPVIRVWPGWFERVPYLTSRIQTEIVTR